MRFLTFLTLAAVLVVNLLCANLTAASRSYQRRRDLDSVKPVSELGWKVPLLSGEAHHKVELSISNSAHFLVRHTCASASCRRQ